MRRVSPPVDGWAGPSPDPFSGCWKLPDSQQRVKGCCMAGKFEVYEDKAGKFRFRLKAGNGEIVAVGEAYDTMASAKEGCAAVQRAADGASVVEADN